MQLKATILTPEQISRSLVRITHEIIEKNPDLANLRILGIRSRGVPMARMLAANIRRYEGLEIPVGSLDARPFRDDLSEGARAMRDASEIAFDLEGRDVVLVDDVLFTGRTVRAAIEAVFTRARPKTMQLAVLVDRGHRELPVRPDFVGKNIPTSRAESVSVRFEETDGAAGVFLFGP